MRIDNLAQPLVIVPLARWPRITEKGSKFRLEDQRSGPGCARRRRGVLRRGPADVATKCRRADARVGEDRARTLSSVLTLPLRHSAAVHILPHLRLSAVEQCEVFLLQHSLPVRISRTADAQ